jgi:CheY-like chemotaxis protein
MLKQLGYSVTAASDGATALSLLGSEDAEYQLVISDLVMPRMGGAELHRKAIAERPRLRFLFASGYSSEAVGKQLPIGPLVGFLSKPYGLGDLARKVREVLDGGEPEGPAGVA